MYAVNEINLGKISNPFWFVTIENSFIRIYNDKSEFKKINEIIAVSNENEKVKDVLLLFWRPFYSFIIVLKEAFNNNKIVTI